MSQLSYSIPDVGRKKSQLRIPESHTLYVCPQSCARRQFLRAIRNGEADKVSVLKLTQADLVSGDYEGEVARAIEQLLQVLPQAPRVLQIIVHCIDDFLGTDGENLVAGLREEFPQLRFTLMHENPISVDVARDALSKMQSGLYAPLEIPARHDTGVNTLGSFEPLPAESEIFAFLDALVAGPLRHIATCENFDEYQQMAASAVSISLDRRGDSTVQSLAERFATLPLIWHATYSLDQVKNKYQQLLSLLQEGCMFDAAALTRTQSVLADAEQAAKEAIDHARQAVGDTPLVVDSSTSFSPCDLARELAEYGFNVKAVVVFHMKGAEVEQEQRLLEAFPQVQVIKDQSALNLQQTEQLGDALSIGVDGEFLFGCKRVVRGIYHDEGAFGYQGIRKLMSLMTQAVN